MMVPSGVGVAVAKGERVVRRVMRERVEVGKCMVVDGWLVDRLMLEILAGN